MYDLPVQSRNLQGKTMANGRFVITELLGSGGMADVFRAYDNRSKRDVAVKLPKSHLSADIEFVKRFEREIKIMRGLKHPHIVPVVFAGVHDGCTYAAFPYLTGGSLGDHIKQHKTFLKTPTTIADLRWVTQIALALDYLHGQGLLHRDVKPDNILFDAHRKAYLSDFGIVRALDPEKGGKAVTELTAADMTIGTAPYMALELLLCRTPYTGAVDQYALAVTLYETLTGRKPYQGSAREIVFEQARTKPPLLGELRRDLPVPLSKAVHRAMSRSPDSRFPSCIEFAQAVAKTLPGPPRPKSVSPNDEKSAPSRETVIVSIDIPTQESAAQVPAANRRVGDDRVTPAGHPHGQPLVANNFRRRWIGGVSFGATLLLVILLLVWLFRHNYPTPSSNLIVKAPNSTGKTSDKDLVTKKKKPVSVTPLPDPKKNPATKVKPDLKQNEKEKPNVELKPKSKQSPPPVVEPKPKPKSKQSPPPVVEPKPDPKPNPTPLVAGWRPLFNGINLAQFEQRNGTATFHLDIDGVIVGKTSEGSPNSFLCTKKQYGDFELAFEVKTDDQLNVGVQIRSASRGAETSGRVYGPQVEISVNGNAGFIYGEALGTGWLSQNLNDPVKNAAFKKGVWNRFRVLAVGKSIKTWVNGVQVADLVDEKSGMYRGFIGLQVHGIRRGTGPYEARWRNLRIRELTRK